MPDLTDRLAQLNDTGRGVADDSVIAGDLARGRNALKARRLRVGGGITIAALAITTVTSLAYAASGNDSRGTPKADPGSHRPSVSVPATTHKVTTGAPVAASIKLVAYHGKNLPGYSVTRIPEGYVLQGISGSVLDVAQAGDHSDLNTFVGKLVVSVDADVAIPTSGGVAVTVHGKPGRILTDDGVSTLYYLDGKYDVQVQKWSNINLTNDQLVQFAEGVTVLPSIQQSHG